MIICIDVGNSQIFLGVFDQAQLVAQARYNTANNISSDQFGIFLKAILAEHEIQSKQIKDIAICSVVPDLDYSITSACIKYFEIVPLFVKSGVKTGVKIKYANSSEVGADRIANTVGAIDMYKDQNLVVIDFGTATTLCAITALKEYYGGAILPGIKTSAKALASMTAKLPMIEILKPRQFISNSTIETIQVGIFYAQLGAVKEILDQMVAQVFQNKPHKIIGTGGFAHLFAEEGIFDAIVPDLVLRGLCKINEMNKVAV